MGKDIFWIFAGMGSLSALFLVGVGAMAWLTTPELNTTTIYKQDRIASSSCTEGAGG